MNLECQYFNQSLCQSCSLLPTPYPTQIFIKENALREALAFSAAYKILPTVSSRLSGFRNKAKMVVGGTVSEPTIGLLDNREILDCPVHHPEINRALHRLKSFITECKIEPYQIVERKGELKTIILYYSENSKEMYVRFVTRTTETHERIRKNSAKLMHDLPMITCLSANLQPIPHAILEGPEEILLAGNVSIRHRLKNLELELRPKAFVQTNQVLAEGLYETAARWMNELKIKRMSELFCGQGTFSFFAKDTVEAGLGIEINLEAIQSAKALAEKLNTPHLQFIAAPAGQVENQLRQFQPDLVLVNPPRKGLGDALALMQKSRFLYLIYSSCAFDTLSADLKSLPQYEVMQAQIFDLFPHTQHFETLVLLRLKND